MHSLNFRNLFNLHRYQKIVALFGLLLAFSVHSAEAQRQFAKYNLPFSDDKWLHYGFSIGIHSAILGLKYSDQYPGLDSLHSINPSATGGFSLGFISDIRLADQLNLRFLPKVSFYEFHVDYFFTTPKNDLQKIEATYVEFPLLLKYKSQRHKNFRMYMVGGLTPWVEATGKKRKENSDNKLLTQNFNLAVEVGFGVDLYYPLFKFSPEIRFSKGLLNMLKRDEDGYHEGINTLSTNVISLYFQFSD
ncbi:MAG TPA: PorT family protein [Cytophagales bacterium]|jgi:hypothetical protein|nr:PorT family protein [Cytophagales bacterium]